jgi:hypothetical protein
MGKIKIIKKKEIIPFETRKENIKWQGNQVVGERYKGKFSRDAIKAHVQAKSDAMKQSGFDGKISVALYYPERDWRSGYATAVGEPIALYNIDSYAEDDEPDVTSFTHFNIYYMKNAPKKGGCNGSRNDCLFDCLKQLVIHDFPWKYPASLKTYLKLERNDKVDIDLIPQLEEKLQAYKINVTGDHTYTSTKDARCVINLKLINSHYKVVANKDTAMAKSS